MLSYDDTHGRYKPFHVDADGGPEDCTHGLKGCTMCTRACPRFRLWEPEIDTHLFGRERTTEEVAGISSDTLLVRATDPEVLGAGQDGGLVSAMLVWALEHDVIDAALVSYLEGDGSSWKAVPGVATTRAEVLAAAGSRYTYSANPLAYPAAIEGGAERIALVGMGCQASAAPMMKARKAGKIARRLSLTIGLLCSKTFDDAIFPELFEARYNIARAYIAKMNIKGVFQVWTQGRGVPRDPAQGGPRLDPRGVHDVSGLRRRARRHLHRRDRGLQRLDPHPRPYRRRARAAQGDAGRRRDRDPSGRRRPRGHRPAPPPGPGEPAPVARDRRAHAPAPPAGRHPGLRSLPRRPPRPPRPPPRRSRGYAEG